MGKLPKVVSVLGQKVKIITNFPKNFTKAEVDEYSKCYGVYFPDLKTIWINTTLSNEIQWQSLYHELGHAIIHRSGVRFSGTVDPKIEEIIVETMGSVFYEFSQQLRRARK